MTTPDESGTMKVITGALLIIVALTATEALLWHMGGLVAAIAAPSAALVGWAGYRLVTVPVDDGDTVNGNGSGAHAADREHRARPRADEPHTW